MLLKSHGVMDDVRFRYLAAKCLAEVEQWDECLTLLGDGELDDDMQEVREGGLRGCTHTRGKQGSDTAVSGLDVHSVCVTARCSLCLLMCRAPQMQHTLRSDDADPNLVGKSHALLATHQPLCLMLAAAVIITAAV